MNNATTEYKPCKGLRSFVELYWEGNFDADGSGCLSMQMIPNGCLELIIHLNDHHCDLLHDESWSQTPDYLILGLYTQPFEVQFTGSVKVFAIRFKPEGIYNVLGVPASKFKESHEDVSIVLDSKFQSFCHRLKEEKSVSGMIRLTENYLLMSLQTTKIDMSYINVAANLIRSNKGIRIEDLPGKVFISQRQLEREFKDKVGISPKHYLRITRINEVLRLLNGHHELNLVNVAYHCGYADQAHFIKDFKKITGEKPTIYMKERARFISNPGLAYYI